MPSGSPSDGASPLPDPDALTQQTYSHHWLQAPPVSSSDVTPPSSAEELAERLSLSGLFSRDQLDALRGSLDDSNAQSFADSLVKEGRLTEFQAEVLLEGQGRSLVLGNYSLIGKLGEGGMGQVFMAVHRRMNRQVALKVLPAGLTNSEAAISRFRREVEAAAKLVHPNIAAAYDADEYDGIHFLVMEYVDGPNLSAYVKQAGPLPVAAAVHLVLQAARGLVLAHEVGVVHRDIKPANLVVDRKGTLKVLDMGLARLADNEENTQLTQSGKVMGTVDFMAPEQAIDAKRVDHRVDIYSLGCTLYYLLTGKTLSPEGTLTQKLLWHQNEESRPLGELRDDVPAGLEATYMAMVARDPNDRQTSMAEVVQDLQACLAELPAEELHLELIDVALDSHAPGSTPAAGSSPSISRARRSAIKSQGFLARLTRGQKLGGGLGLGALVLVAGFLLKPPAAPPEPHELLTEFALRHGGSVSIGSAEGGAPKTIEAAEELPEDGYSLKAVDLSGTSVLDDDFDAFPEVRGLRVLSLADTSIGDGALASLRRLGELSELDLSGTQLSDSGLEMLASLVHLRTLNLQKTAISDEGLAQLAPLVELERLYLSNTAVGDAGLAHVPALTGLRSLAINGTTVTSRGHATLRDALPELEITWDGQEIDRQVANWILDGDLRATVSLSSRSGETIEGLAMKADLPAETFHLVAVDLSRNLSVTNEDLTRLGDLKRLRHLDLSGTGITSGGLEELKTHRRLKTLELGQLELSEQSLQELRAALPKCGIEHRAAEDSVAAAWALGLGGKVTLATPDGEVFEGLSGLDELPKGEYRLRAVNLEGLVDLGDEDLAHLRDLPSLEALFLVGTAVTDVGLEHLAGCASLRVLGLSDTAVTDVGLEEVARLRPLRQLHLAGTNVTGQGLQALRSLESLTHLSLARTQLVDGDLVHLKAFPAVEWLSLSGTPFTNESVPQLERLETLTELWIKDTDIDDDGSATLAAALPDCLIQQ